MAMKTSSSELRSLAERIFSSRGELPDDLREVVDGLMVRDRERLEAHCDDILESGLYFHWSEAQ